MTINDIKKAPQNFLYIYATDSFLAKLDSKTAAIIRSKRGNQSKVINNACIKEKEDYSTVVSEINDSLKENFGHSGAECLMILADGGQVAGKDWSAGIYGIGDTREGFQGTSITVNAETGKLMQGGVEVSGQTAIYGKNSTTYTAVVDGVTYSSAYKGGKYVAGNYTSTDGTTYNAAGQATGLAGFNNIWTAVQSYAPIIQQIINWLASMFPAVFSGKTLVTTENTIPSQSDGFVQKSSISAGTVLAFAGIAAGVYLLADKKSK